MLTTLRRTALALAAAALASACGGGGDAGPAPDTTPPAVVSFDPLHGTTAVSRAAPVVVTFSEPVDPETVASVTLEGPSGLLTVTATLSAGNTVLTLEPDAALANYRAHTVRVGTGVKDAAGNALAAAASATFTTRDDVGPTAPADLAGPAFASIAAPAVTFTWAEPSDDGIEIIASYDVEVATSGAPFAPVTVTATTVALGNQGARDGERLSARVRARDAAGNAGTWSEWSAPVTVDVTGPTAAPAPAQGPTGVSRTGPFTVTFDEPVLPASVTASSVVLETLGGTPVAYAPDLEGEVLTLVPDAPLAHWGEHRLRVTPAVTDLAGNPLGATVASPAGAGSASTFRAADAAPPVMAGGVSTAGAFDDATMTFTWPEASDVGAGVAGYEVRIAHGVPGNFRDPVFVTTTAFVFDPRAEGDGTRVWAEVRPVDGALNDGAPELSGMVVYDGEGPTAPGQPQGSDAFALGSPVRFGWAAAADLRSGVASYAVVAATSTTGGTPLSATDPGFSTSTDVTALVDGAKVYVQVTATDRVGNVGAASAWSAPVTMDLAPPSAPGALSPPQGTIAGSPVAFGWTAATDTNGIAFYQLDVRTAAAGAGDAVFVGTTAALSLGVSGADGQVLHARVRAVDAAGRLGPWATSAVTVDAAPPGAPGVPADGDVTGASLALSWDEAVDAVSSVVRYLGEVSADEAFLLGGTLAFDATAATTTLDVGAFDGQTIYVRVQAVDAFGHAGDFAHSDGVLVDATPPSKPEAPQDGGLASRDPQLHFFWTPASDTPGSGVAGYTCQIAAGEEGPVEHLAWVESTDAACDYTAAMNQRVFARVRARDVAGNEADFTDWSDGILVTTAAPPTPGAPQAPARYLATTNVPFAWTGSLGAGQSYRLQVGTSPGASDELNLPNHPANGYAFAGAHGATYYARVRIDDASTGFSGAFSESSDPVTVDLTPPGSAADVVGRGPLDDEAVSFTWTAATDAESGVDRYEVEVSVDGGVAGTFDAYGTSYTFGPASHGAEVTARVRAVNGAGTRSATWSAPSPAVTVDADAPSAWPDLSNHQPHATNVDLVLRFDEPMDQASVEAAFSVAWGAGERPAHGYVFHWTDPQRVVIVPDTQAPAGETNVDLLPEATDFVMTLGTGATDLAGNGLNDPMTLEFSTRDETEPKVLAIVEKRSGAPSPFDPASVESVTLLVRFDEDMSPMQASVRLQRPDDWIEGSVQGRGIQTAQTVAGGIAYTLSSCGDVRVGDVVSVSETGSPEWQVSHATVTSVTGPCTVTVSTTKVPGAPWAGGGRMTIPGESPGRPRLQWIAPRELQIEFPAHVSLAAGDEAELELWNVGDLSWNSVWVREVAQVATAGETARPVLLGSVPQHGAANVRGALPVVLRFSEPLRATTVAGIAAECDGCDGLYELDYSVDEYGPIVVLAPRASPPAGTTVTVRVPGTVEDLAGNGAIATSVTFTVEDELEEGTPQVRDTTPPAYDGDVRPVDQVWSLGFTFEDEETGLLEIIDGRSVGANDFRVVDRTTGLLVRGFRPRTEAGRGSVDLRPAGNGSGLGAGRSYLDVTAVDAGGGFATYTTRDPHGMEPGGKVWISMNPGHQAYQAWDALVTAIPDATRFTIASQANGNASGAGATIGNATVPAPRRYDVEVLPALGSDGIVDAHGNPLSAASLTFDILPWGSRVPYVAELQDLRVEASTSPAARTLHVEARVNDPDQGSVSVSLWDADGVLSGTAADVSVGPWSGGSYRHPSSGGEGGPPTASSPPELDEYDGSGWYPFELVLDDGVHETRYRREVWLWAPEDAPDLASIEDGGISRPVGELPIGVAEGDPVFAWAGLDAVNADLAALYVVSLERLADESRGGFLNVSLLAPQAEGSATLAVTLEPDVYLWTVVQQKFAPGSFDPASSAWSIDVTAFAKALFAIGPDNAALARPAGAVFAGARMGVDRGAAFGAVGTFTFEEPAGKVPVLVTAALDDQHGDPLAPTSDLFAYGAGKRFTMTQTSAGSPMMVPMHGVVGMDATFFAVVQEDPALATFQAGAYRYQQSGFGTGLDGRFVFVQASASVTGGSGGADGSVGRATFDPLGVVTLDLTMFDGTEETGFALPYTVGDDGRLTIALEEAPGAGTATGLLGGAAGAEIAVLSQADVDAAEDRYFWLLAVREYDWAPDADESILSGTYRFADYAAEGGETFAGARGASGSMTFDGAGGVTYEGTADGDRFTGFGEYEVLPLEGKVIFTRLDGNPGADRFTLVLGQGADVVLGGATDPAGGVAEVLVLAR
jgi:hypothetical protein